jgi:hypothetical protein
VRQLKFIKFFAHPLFIAAVLSLIALPFLFKHLPKYLAKVTDSGILSKRGSCLTWADLYNDGESENIEWFVNSEGKVTLKISSQTGIVIDQQVLNGKSLVVRNPPCYADLDRDQFPEIYAFYHRSDSLFFTSVEYAADSSKSVSKEVFITMVPNNKGENDYTVDYSLMDDLDGDFVSELIFSLNAGYPIIPRNIFSYNVVKNELKHSKFLGANSGVNYIIDLNRDGKKELLIGQYAPGNLHDSLIEGINDQFVKLLVLNDRLEPIFETPVFEGEYSSIIPMPVRQKDEIYIAAMINQVLNAKKNCWLMLFTPEGRLISKRNVKDLKNKNVPFLFEMRHSKYPIHIFDREGVITAFDLNLQPVEKKKYPLMIGYPLELDLDQDGENEYLFYHSAKPFLSVARREMTNFVRVILPNDVTINGRFYLKKNIGKPNEFSFQYGEKYSLVSYATNPYYPFRFLFWLAGFYILSGFIFLIQYLQRLALRDKYRTERRVSELQLLLLRNQISPHFLFNAISSISYRLMVKNPEEANNSVMRLSRLIRNNLVATDRFSRSLKEEIESVTAYIEIVLMQCEEPFSFTTRITTATNLDIEVPVLVIQNYLENAVKHGVRSLGSKGRIDLSIDQDLKFLHIQISDNGIGRKKALQNEDKSVSTGKGIGLMQQFFDEVNNYNENKITAVIRDLSDEKGSPAGTQVNIEIPLNMKYRIYEK